MSWREFLEWQIYHSLYPLGERRADLRAGIVASTIANVNRGPDTAPFHPFDFMPSFGIADEEEEIDEDASIALTQNIFESLTIQLGGEVKG